MLVRGSQCVCCHIYHWCGWSGQKSGVDFMPILWRLWKHSVLSFERGEKRKSPSGRSLWDDPMFRAVCFVLTLHCLGSWCWDPESGTNSINNVISDNYICCCCYYYYYWLSITMDARHCKPSITVSLYLNASPAQLFLLVLFDTRLRLRKVGWVSQLHTGSFVAESRFKPRCVWLQSPHC